MRFEHTTNSEQETIALGSALGAAMKPGDVLALDGPLGAGKTRLVRGIVAGLGGDPDQVSSPTFVFMNEYDTGKAGAPLVHVDAYRLNGPDDLDSIGWDAAMASPAITVIEWAERVQAALEPNRTAHVEVAHAGDTRRRLIIDLPEAWLTRPELGAALDLLLTPKSRLPAGWSRCPVTGRAVHESAPTFPFVDERARLADLGRWFTGAYTVSRELSEEDLTDPDLLDRE